MTSSSMNKQEGTIFTRRRRVTSGPRAQVKQRVVGSTPAPLSKAAPFPTPPRSNQITGTPAGAKL